MILSRVVPVGAGIAVDAPDARSIIAELYRPPSRHWVRLNLIGSVSGSAAGVDGTSDTLTNRTDRLILGVIRDHSDAVLVGAASVRAEGYVVPKHAALAVVTGSGDFTGHRVVRSRGRLGELVILCPAAAADTARRTLGEVDARIIVVPDTAGRLTPADILAALRATGFTSIACEGGPSLAAQIVDAGLVDEICLTTSPVLNGGALPLFGSHSFAEKRLTLTQLLMDEAHCLYARWAVAAG